MTILITVAAVYVLFAIIGAITAWIGIVRRNRKLYVSIYTEDVIAAIARAFTWPVVFVWAFFDNVYNSKF